MQFNLELHKLKHLLFLSLFIFSALQVQNNVSVYPAAKNVYFIVLEKHINISFYNIL